LREAGLSEVSTRFSVAPVAHEIPAATLAGIDAFVRVFDRVTARPGWRRAVATRSPEIARAVRPEVCFFSAWDFHLPAGAPEGWQLIEFNDNGSGFLFAALINRIFYELAEEDSSAIQPPPRFSEFGDRVLQMIQREYVAFFGEPPSNHFVILDDAESLERGRFRAELRLLRDLLRRKQWKAEIASPEQLAWDGRHLWLADRVVSFVVNRSTDFFWEAEAFSALRAAYEGRRVYVAPNPFTYATRSDKRVLEWLSLPARDEELGIEYPERELLSAHVPETRIVSEENLDELARHKVELVFKPAHGYASRGLLPSDQLGRTRLRRLLRKGSSYVAQRKVEKLPIAAAEPGGGPLWADLRVWAYRGELLLLSGRGSRRPDALDLRPPGGWLPTYART
jgi:hypothetical protein